MTPASARKLPHAMLPPAYAIASAIAMAYAATGRGNDAVAVTRLVAALAGVGFSTWFTVRTYRRLADEEFSRDQIFRYLGVILAGAVNGVVAFMVTGILLLVLGVMVTGRGVAG